MITLGFAEVKLGKLHLKFHIIKYIKSSKIEAVLVL